MLVSSFILYSVITTLVVIVGLLISIAYLTLMERHYLSSIQRRMGPNIVGFFGLLQPLADGLKLLTKQNIVPSNVNNFLFMLAPIITFGMSLVSWTVIPFAEGVVFCNINLGILFILAISSLSVYGILISGWSSNSKYAFLGSLRSAAQMLSYEISMGFILVNVILCAGSLNITEIILAQQDIWYIIPLWPVAIMFFVSILAETNRPPFDLPEAEAELVAGYNIEYAGMGFALFFLGEYGSIILMSTLFVICFLGGFNAFPIKLSSVLYPTDLNDYVGINKLLEIYYPDVYRMLQTQGDFFFVQPYMIEVQEVFENVLKTPVEMQLFVFIVKTLFIVLLFIFVRGAFPRYRFDQLMVLGWKVMLPLSFAMVFYTTGMLFGTDGLPMTTI